MLRTFATGMMIADATIYENDDGTKVAVFPLAHRRRRDENDNNNVVRVRVNGVSDKFSAVLRKGTFIAVVGVQSARDYQTRDGTRKVESVISAYQSNVDIVKFAPIDEPMAGNANTGAMVSDKPNMANMPADDEFADWDMI